MRTNLFALLGALVLALANTGLAAAQNKDARGKWSDVQSIARGAEIAVRTRDGDRLTGRFADAGDDAINFTHDGKRVTLTRDSVRNVKISRGRNRLKGALVGAGIGGGAGAGAGGFVVAHTDHFGGTPLGAGIGIGAGAGAAIGAAIGLGKNYETVYEAP
ncbi:MAG TPA: hypothetical protein VFA21_08340 [Pyrinomonadaceae bacterium]|nr:hypothetical protein [Pyrinomonadaceae bacterium]